MIGSIKGYTLFAKKESLNGVVISIVIAVLMMVLAWYLCLSLDVYRAYQDWFANGEVDYTITFWEAVRGAYLFLSDGEILVAYLKDLLIGLLLCVVGAFRFVVDAVRRVRQEQTQPAPAVYKAPLE